MSFSPKEALRKAMPEQAWTWLKRRGKDVLLWYVVPRAYRKASNTVQVNPNKALFVEMNAAEPSASEQLVLEALRDDYGYEVDFYSLRVHYVGFLKRARNYCELARRVVGARYVVICEAMNMIACLPLRPETKVVQLWHGCGAFKRFGMSTADKIFGASRSDKQRHPDHENTSLVAVSSPEVVWAYEEAMCFEDRPGIVRPLGVSRTDVFFDQEYLSRLSGEAHQAVPACKGKRILVYAPTFRGRVSTAEAPNELDLPYLKERLGGEWVLLIKHHPHVMHLPEIPEDCRDFAFDVTHELSIDQLMAASDACISDYSSLVYEYSLLGKPMAFFAYDLEEYDDWRGFYYSYEDLTPGPIFRDTASLAEWVAHVDECFDPKEVAAFRERFMGSCDGNSTKRICEALLSL